MSDSNPTYAVPRRLIHAGLLVVVLAGAIAAITFFVAFRNHPSALRRVCQNGYCLTLPSSWHYRDASYPSNHATYYYWNPDNALEQLTIVRSGCIGCVTKNNDGIHPDPTREFPLNVTAQREVSPYKIRYRAYETRSPYPTDGFVYITHDAKGITGSIILALDLPDKEHALAEQVIDSFALQG